MDATQVDIRAAESLIEKYWEFLTHKGNRIRITGSERNKSTGLYDWWIKNLETHEYVMVTKEQLRRMVASAVVEGTGQLVPVSQARQISMSI